MSWNMTKQDALDALEELTQRAQAAENRVLEQQEILNVYRRDLAAAQDQVREFTRLALGRPPRCVVPFPIRDGRTCWVEPAKVIALSDHVHHVDQCYIFTGPNDDGFHVFVSIDEAIRRLGFTDGGGA